MVPVFRSVFFILVFLLLFGPANAAAPVANFAANATSGTAPLAISFTDSSTNTPTGWAWFFGDEPYTQPWIELNASSGWSERKGFATVAMADGSIILMGGTGPSTYMNDTWRSIDQGRTWTLMNTSCGWAPRYGHSSVVMPNNSIVLMGGWNITSLNDVWISADYGAHWNLVTATPGWSARQFFGSVVMPNSSIVIMGGGSDTDYLNDTWISTNYGLNWTQANATTSLWSKRDEMKSVVMPDGSIILVGGYGSDGLLKNDTWRSMDYGASWTLMNTSPGWSSRADPSMVAMPDGSILLMGGYVGGGLQANDTWRSIDYGRNWTRVNVSSGWEERHCHSSVLMADGSIVLMGGEGTSFYNDTWQFSPRGSNLQNPYHVYPSTGVYNVSLQVFNSEGYSSMRKTAYITVTQVVDPVASFTVNVTLGTTPLAVQFNDTSTNSPTSWNWSFRNVTGNNTLVPWSIERNATLTFGTGNFSIALNATNSAGFNISSQVLFVNVTAANNLPVASNVQLTSTSGFNRTADNLTLSWSVSDPDGNPVRNITNWYRNGTSIMSLNMPFEGGSTSSFTRDYSGFGNNGTVTGATWNATGGPDGSGAYYFSGSNQIDAGTFNPADPAHTTLSAWVYPVAGSASANQYILAKGNDATDYSYGISLYGTSSSTLIARIMIFRGSTLYWAYTPAGNISYNTWHHVAGTINGNVLSIYLDGECQDSTTLPFSTISNTTQSVYIGGQNRGGYYYRFKGYIDNIAVYNRALSPEQIQALSLNRTSAVVYPELREGDTWYGSVTPNDGVSDGGTVSSGLVTINATNPIASFSANITTGTAPFAVQFNDTSSYWPASWSWSFNNLTGNNTRVFWSTGQNPLLTFGAGNFSIVLNTTNSAGFNISTQVLFVNVTAANNPPVASNVLLTSTSGFNRTTDYLTMTWTVSDPEGNPVRNITNWYRNGTSITALNMPFEGGSNSIFTKDYSGYGNNGTVNGAVWNSTGGYDGGGAYNISGTQYISVPDSPSLDVNGTGLALEAWVFPRSFSDYMAIAGKEADSFAEPYWVYQLEGFASGVTFRLSTEGGARKWADSPTLTANQWYHVVGTYNGTYMNLYINGNLTSSTPQTGNVTTSKGKFSIGRFQNGNKDNFNGIIDSVRVYNRSLSTTEVSTLYRNRTDLIVPNELRAGDYWNGSVTPNDGISDGETAFSNFLNVTSPPVASFTSNITSGIAPLTVQFTDTSTGAPTSWNWSFGDIGAGNFSTSQNPVHTYSSAGSYNVTLNATGTLGSDVKTVTYYINVTPPQPLASFSANASWGRSPLTVLFTDSSTNTPTSWNWSFTNVTGNNTQVFWSTAQNPTLTFGPGNFQIALNATSSAGFNISARALFVNVSVPPPVSGFTANVTSGTAPLSVQFNDSTTGSPAGWAWYFGDETYSASWTQMTPAAGWSARYNHVSVALPDGSIVLSAAGGGSGDVWRSIDKGASWTLVNASMGWSSRDGAGAVVLNDGSIVMMGGAVWGTLFNDVVRSTDKGATWTQMTSAAGWSGRGYAKSIVLPDDSIVTMGGLTCLSGCLGNDVWRSTDKGATWSQMTSSPGWTARSDHTSLALPDGSMVIMGGGLSDSTNVWRSTDKGATWSQINASPPWGRRGSASSVTMPDGSIVLMGGNMPGTTYGDVWRSTDMGVTWKQVSTSPGWGARYGHTSVLLPDGSIVIMGGNGGSLYHDVWRVQPAGTTAQNVTHTYTIPGTYTVALQTYNDGGGNNTIKTGYITVNSPTPVASFTGSGFNGKPPLLVQFNDTSSNVPTAWNWSFGDGAFSNVQNASHTYTTIGLFNVSLTASNSAGSNITLQHNYTRVSDVTANFSWTCNATVSYQVDFQDTSTSSFPPIESHFWDFGDGNTTWTSAKPFHTFPNASIAFPVWLQVWDSLGGGGVDNATVINVTPCNAVVPVAIFTTNVSSGPSPVVVQFFDNSTGSPESWNWTFGDGNVSSLKNPVHRYGGAGKYNVSLVVNNSYGSNTSTKIGYIHSVTVPTFQYVTKWGSSGSGSSQFDAPWGISVTPSGMVYVADMGNSRIQKFFANGTFQSIFVSSGAADGQVTWPHGLTTDSSGNVYTTDAGNYRIEKFSSSGTYLMKLTGFNVPDGIAVDNSGNIYVAESFNTQIQKFASDGTYITQWGSAGTGPGQFDHLRCIAVDSKGNVYTGDETQRIQKFSSDGTFLLQWGSSGTGSGQFSYPRGIAIDTDDNVFVADTWNNRIQEFTSDGIYVTQWGTAGSGDGQFNLPEGIAFDSTGKLYVADSQNARVQVFSSGWTLPLTVFTVNTTTGTSPLSVQFTDTSSNYPTSWKWAFRNVTGNNTQISWSTLQNPTGTFSTGNYSILLNASNSAGYNISTQITFINVTPAVPAGNGTTINQTATIFIGEDGLNLTHALNQAQGSSDINGIPTLLKIGWWASSSDLWSSSPSKYIALNSRYQSFTASPADFVGYTGKWYVLFDNVTTPVSATELFTVQDPSLDIRIWDLDHNTNVTGGTISRGTRLGFRIDTNMYNATSGRSPLNAATDGFITIKVKNASGVVYQSLYNDSASAGSRAGPTSLLANFVSSQPYFWGSSTTHSWYTDARDNSSSTIYPDGVYTITAESTLNHMMDNYKLGTANYTGKTVSPSYTITIGTPAAPVVSFTKNVTEGTIPFAVAFTDTSAGSPISWNWSFGDGNYSSLQNPEYTFVEQKVHNVTLTAWFSSSLSNKTLQQVTGYAKVVVANATINGTSSTTVSGNQTMLVNTTAITASGGTVTSTDTTVVITGANSFWESTQIFAKNVSLNATAGNYSIVNVTQVVMQSAPVTAALNESVGNVSVSLDVALKQYVPDANISITITEGATTGTTNAFQLAAQNASITITDIAYTVQITNTEIINTNLTQNATRSSKAAILNMSVNHSWVSRFSTGSNNGGRDAITVVRYPETGNPKVLPTRFVTYDSAQNLDWFEADSVDGFSVFGMVGYAAQQAAASAPQAPSNSAPAAAPANAGGGGKGSGGAAKPDSAKPEQKSPVSQATILTTTAPLSTDKTGALTQAVHVQSADHIAMLALTQGTRATDSAGHPLTKVGIYTMDASAVPNTADIPQYSFSGIAFQCEPDGAQFSPAITLTYTLSRSQWDTLYADNHEPVIRTFSQATNSWASLSTTADPTQLTLSAPVTHFSDFALFTRPAKTNGNASATISPTPAVQTGTGAAPKPANALEIMIGLFSWSLGIAMESQVILVICVVLVVLSYIGWRWYRKKKRYDFIMYGKRR